MYKVKEEALLQELSRLEMKAKEQVDKNMADAREVGLKRGYSQEKIERVGKLLLSEDEIYSGYKKKADYLADFVEEVADEAPTDTIVVAVN